MAVSPARLGVEHGGGISGLVLALLLVGAWWILLLAWWLMCRTWHVLAAAQCLSGR
jgi:hypothetical protein